MRMRTATMALILCATAIATGCGHGDGERRLVETFLNDNLTDNAISGLTISDTDSTSHVSDSLITVMRTDAAKSHMFRSDVRYGERDKSAPLHYVTARYNTDDGKKLKQTFYLNTKTNSVVCVKTDPTNGER